MKWINEDVWFKPFICLDEGKITGYAAKGMGDTLHFIVDKDYDVAHKCSTAPSRYPDCYGEKLINTTLANANLIEARLLFAIQVGATQASPKWANIICPLDT